MASLAVGFATWAYTLLTPAVLLGGGSDPVILRDGPFGITWLRPQALFGVSGLDPLTHGVLWSLSLNLVCLVGVSPLRSPGLRERRQAAKFLDDTVGAGAPERGVPRSLATIGDPQELVGAFSDPREPTHCSRNTPRGWDRKPSIAAIARIRSLRASSNACWRVFCELPVRALCSPPPW